MRRWVGLLLMILAMGGPARADEAAIRSVISNQIEAFQADDFSTAFTFASPKIQRLFGNPDNFGMMVRQGYPMVWRPSETRFLGVDIIAGQLWQNVMIRDQNGQVHILEYQMINGADGWKIDAVRFKRPSDGAV